MTTLWLILTFLILALAIWVCGEAISRDEARKRADQFIARIREPTPEKIDKCIAALKARNRMLLSDNETDRLRVKQLHDIRNKMVTRHL